MSTIYEKFQRGIEPVALKNAVRSLIDWSIKWQLPIAGEKCAVLSLGAGNKQEDYAVKNIRFPHPENIRDLGIMITPNLKSSVHCSLIAKDADVLMNVSYLERTRRKRCIVSKRSLFPT